MGLQKRILQLTISKLLNSTGVIIDTETTGLTYADEIIEISIIDMAGKILLDTLVKPTRPIPAAATAINQITDEMVAGSPSWPEVYPKVMEIIGGHRWIGWNSAFDARLMTQTSLITGVYDGLSPVQLLAEYERVHGSQLDAKPIYSAWYGELDEARGSFVRQSLSAAARQNGLAWSGDAHRSLADCLMVLNVIRHVSEIPEVPTKGFILELPQPLSPRSSRSKGGPLLNEGEVVEAVRKIGGIAVTVCPLCGTRLDLTHRPNRDHYCSGMASK